MTQAAPSSGILVLDSDEANARTLAERLTQHGISSLYSTDPAQALELVVKSDKYGVVLMETALPGKTGFELAQEIRNERISRPEIILMTQDPRITLFDCHQAGACYLIRKPVNFDELGLVLKRFTHIQHLAANASKDSVAAMGRLYGQIRILKQNQEFPVEVSNLGRGGFFCRTNTDRQLPLVGQIIDFNLRLGMVPNCECQGRGIIRWAQPAGSNEAGVGIEFLKVPDWFHQTAHAFADLFKIRPFIPNC